MSEKPYEPSGSRPGISGSTTPANPAGANTGTPPSHFDHESKHWEQTKQELKHSSEEIRAKADETTEKLKRSAKETAAELQHKAEQIGEDAKRQGQAYAEEQKRYVSDEMHGAADALHGAADKFREHEQERIARYIDQAATSLDDISSSLRQQDFDQLLNKTQNFAREQPAIFLGGAVAIGFALGRFLKSSARHSESDYWGEQNAYDRPSYEYRQGNTTLGSTSPRAGNPPAGDRTTSPRRPDIGNPTTRTSVNQPSPGE